MGRTAPRGMPRANLCMSLGSDATLADGEKGSLPARPRDESERDPHVLLHARGEASGLGVVVSDIVGPVDEPGQTPEPLSASFLELKEK